MEQKDHQGTPQSASALEVVEEGLIRSVAGHSCIENLCAPEEAVEAILRVLRDRDAGREGEGVPSLEASEGDS